MFQPPPQKDQMDLPVVSTRISYVTEDAPLKLGSLNMLLQDSVSDYPTDIPDYRLVPAQDVPNDLILWYVEKIIYSS